jgi:maltooligosyltrehalose trehalohydrolase
MDFSVWAPDASTVEVLVEGANPVRLLRTPGGYHGGQVVAAHGNRYRIRLDDGPALADPRSRWQPEGTLGPSAFVDPTRWTWSDPSWTGLDPTRSQVLYELHVGTFTEGGTFDSAIAELPRLAALGITGVEIMPVSQFSGGRNWGYDGVFPWSVQDTYGGPDGLARFVDAAHAEGIGVILDVVYNHIGPEGDVLPHFGPYFTDRYSTPWGPALNFDGPGSDEVRRYFIDSAIAFVRDHHIDGFRLDAVHAIVDPSVRPFLAQYTDEVSAAAGALHRSVLLIAETAANDERTLRPTSDAGCGFDMQWNDDFHHALRVALTGEQQEYYKDFGGASDVAKSLVDRFVYTGQYSRNHRRRHGSVVRHHDADRFVVFSTNHDHIGNRAEGDRLDASVNFAQRKLAAAAVLLGPFTPMLFMGEEYGETRPFPFFVSHHSAQLVDAVRDRRTLEFPDQDWTPVPDPGDPATMASAVLGPTGSPREAALVALYRDLIALRRRRPELVSAPVVGSVTENDGVIQIRRDTSTVVLNFTGRPTPIPAGEIVWSTSDLDYRAEGEDEELAVGALPPWSATILG